MFLQVKLIVEQEKMKMSYRQLNIKHSYVSYGDENISKAFLIPVLRQTKLYCRSVGFFPPVFFLQSLTELFHCHAIMVKYS